MKSRICELLHVDAPILQGAMAWIADSRLAAAVSQAGGLGIIAAGNRSASWLLSEIRKAKEITDKPFGVNIMMISPYADEVADLICREGVEVVTTGAGNPGKYMNAFKARGIKVIPVIPSVAIARKMEGIGADAVIAEGMEAGGHIGKLTTMALLPQVVDAVSIPVIGAGGIGDGRGMAAAFILGAEGVQLGTRFLTARECNVHQNYKTAVLNAKDIDTTVTGQLMGHSVRLLRNKLSRQLEEWEKEKSHTEVFDELSKGSLRKAVVEGDVENGSLMAGQIAGLCNKEQSCAEIIDEIMKEWAEHVQRVCFI